MLNVPTTPQAERRYRAYVVEDEPPARNYLVELLESSGRAEVVGAAATLWEATAALCDPAQHHSIDVAFVDIRLAGSDETGLDLIRRVAERVARPPAFILATAFAEHAVQAFEVGAVDYLLKPFNEERIEQCLTRLDARRPPVGEPEPARIVARYKKGLVFLERDEVWAFEAAGGLTFVHTPHGRFDMDLSLAAIASSLGRALCRVHRNWLVSLGFVKELSRDHGEARLFVGARVGDPAGVWAPIARERFAEVRSALLADARRT